MNRILILLGLLTTGLNQMQAKHDNTNAATNGILMIDPSSMPVAAGKATLTIGALERAGSVYSGDYRVNVSPYFFKNEKGRLAVTVSDESLAEISRGQVTAIVGTATTSGRNGRSRRIEATAMPIDTSHGTLKLWFTAGEREMTFEPAYHFAGKGTAGGFGKTNDTNTNLNMSGRNPVSHGEAGNATVKLP